MEEEWPGLKVILEKDSQIIYGEILKISPGAYIFKGPLKELIYGGSFVIQN